METESRSDVRTTVSRHTTTQFTGNEDSEQAVSTFFSQH